MAYPLCETGQRESFGYGITTRMHQLLLVSTVMCLLFAPATVAAQSAPPRPSLEIPNIGSLKLGKESTVIVVFATTCEACLKALPFYKKLLALPGMDGVERRMNVMTTDGAVPGTKALDANGITPHHLSSYPNYSAIDVPYVPSTVYVLNAAGQLIGKWTGALTVSNEEEIVAALSGKRVPTK